MDYYIIIINIIVVVVSEEYRDFHSFFSSDGLSLDETVFECCWNTKDRKTDKDSDLNPSLCCRSSKEWLLPNEPDLRTHITMGSRRERIGS